uniref:Target of Myb protein 1 n=1 Tax=Kalanchoe fedtschenkoi TaxID=63787 RepID=A0A7N0VB40_KALFE
MAHSAAACAERATDEMLIGPDWAINIELCDIINMNPGQSKDALKIIKKRLGSKKHNIQLLALAVLDALIKNCGENVIQQIVEREILLEMVKIVKKKPNINVREKILILIDTWQEAIGGKFPQFVQAFNTLRDSGVEFPPREESSATLFTPPQAQPIVHPSNFEDMAIQGSLQDDVSSISTSEMQTAQELADVLMEMLGALDPNNSEGINQELIVDLAEQCQGYQKRVLSLVNNTSDESLLFQGLALNDNLQRVLRRHEDIVKGITNAVPAKTETSAPPPFIGVNNEEDESEDEFSHLAPRSQARRSTLNAEPTHAIPYLPSQPVSRKPISTDATVVDYLSGDTYKSDRPSETTEPSFSSSRSKFPSSPPCNSHNKSPPALYDKQPLYDEPAPVARSPDPLPPAPWEPQAPVSLPPPPAKYNQRQQFFEQHGGSLSSNGGSGSSYDSLVGQTQNLSLNSTPNKGKSEDALFKDLVDFAKAKTSSSSSSASKNSRT